MAKENEFINKAREIVMQYVDSGVVDAPAFKPEDVVVTWFAYTLGNWKALVTITTVDDGLYFEVTYKRENDGSDGPESIYLDVYKHIDHVRFIDKIDISRASIQFHINQAPSRPDNIFYPTGVRLRS